MHDSNKSIQKHICDYFQALWILKNEREISWRETETLISRYAKKENRMCVEGAPDD